MVSDTGPVIATVGNSCASQLRLYYTLRREPRSSHGKNVPPLAARPTLYSAGHGFLLKKYVRPAYLAFSAAMICLFAAFRAGKNPPAAPISSAKIIPTSITFAFTLKLNVKWLHVVKLPTSVLM